MNEKKISILYFLFLTLEIIAALNNYSLGVYLLKPLLMPILLYWYVFSKTKINNFIVLALIFSTLGDIFLMFEKYFLLGLTFFLFAQISYARAFYSDYKNNFVVVAPLLIFGYRFGSWIIEQAPRYYSVAIGLYIIAILFMAYFAFSRNLKRPLYIFSVLGALLFIFSDCLIAIDKFVNPIDYSSLWIMLSYGLAQYFLIKSSIS